MTDKQAIIRDSKQDLLDEIAEQNLDIEDLEGYNMDRDELDVVLKELSMYGIKEHEVVLKTITKAGVKSTYIGKLTQDGINYILNNLEGNIWCNMEGDIIVKKNRVSNFIITPCVNINIQYPIEEVQ